jgi:hypothetical protein
MASIRLQLKWRKKEAVAIAAAAGTPKDRKRGRATDRIATATTAETLEVTKHGELCNRISAVRLRDAETLGTRKFRRKADIIKIAISKAVSSSEPSQQRRVFPLLGYEHLRHYECKRKNNHCVQRSIINILSFY